MWLGELEGSDVVVGLSEQMESVDTELCLRMAEIADGVCVVVFVGELDSSGLISCARNEELGLRGALFRAGR